MNKDQSKSNPTWGDTVIVKEGQREGKIIGITTEYLIEFPDGATQKYYIHHFTIKENEQEG